MFEVYKQKFKQADIVKKYIFVNVVVYIIFVLIGCKGPFVEKNRKNTD